MSAKKMQEQISVIVPIYGVEKYLGQCVESLIDQSYKNLEIILVNDGSPDNSYALCDKYAQLDRRIKVIHKKNGGLVSARKEGLKIATGEYIGYVDGDDWVETRMYEDMMDYALTYEADIVASGHKEELAGEVTEVLLNNTACGLYSGTELVANIYGSMLNTGKFSQFGIFSYLWSKVFRRSVLYDNQMQVDDRIFIAEDAACTYPSLLDASTVYVTDSAYYRYRQRVNSMVKAREVSVLDLERFNALYAYLRNRFRASEHAQLLLPQLDLFMLSLLTVRSDLIGNRGVNEGELFPFPNVKADSRLVICGAGTFGQHLYRGLQASQDSKIIGWVDELSSAYNALGLSVEPLSSILSMDYDHVIVAFIDETVAASVAEKLGKLGVPGEKIAKVSHYIDRDIPVLLKEFGIEN